MGSILLPLAACTYATPCNARKCGGPATVPTFSVHMAVDGKRVPLSSRRTPIKIGRTIRIDVYIGRPNGVDVKNVYLAVNSYPSGINRGVPSERIKILTHHVGSVLENQSVTADWTAGPLFGTRQLDVSVDFEMAGAGVGSTAGQMQLVP